MMLIPYLLLCLALGSAASPLENDKRKTESAVLELSYGTFKSEYDEDTDMSVTSVPEIPASANRLVDMSSGTYPTRHPPLETCDGPNPLPPSRVRPRRTASPHARRPS